MTIGSYDIKRMLSAGKIRQQILQATELLNESLGNGAADLGYAYEICTIWQRRIELALRNEIPDWTSLAAFRFITDYAIDLELMGKLFPTKDINDSNVKSVEKNNEFDTPEKVSHGREIYFGGTPIHSGKFNLRGRAEEIFIENIAKFSQQLGGQSGNILWLWTCLGANCIGYTPYIYKGLVELFLKRDELKQTNFLRFENGQHTLQSIVNFGPSAGVRKSIGPREPAPSGGGVLDSEKGARLIYGFNGVRVLDQGDNSRPWDRVQYFYKGRALFETPFNPEEFNTKHPDNQISQYSWPGIWMFSDCWIDNRTFMIRFIEEDEIKNTFAGKADYAVLGGLNSIFYDPWLNCDTQLQANLRNIIKDQLKGLKEAGIRAGVEISGIPDREFALFIQDLCREDLIVALGINGVDELPKVTGKEILEKTKLFDLFLDSKKLDTKLQEAAEAITGASEHFEYITLLRARKLAQFTGVRTLYVHTLDIDLVLRKDADPGSLLRAQLGDIMSKALVIAALLKRSYGDSWASQLTEKMPPAVKPQAMEKLCGFARDFEYFEGINNSADRILRSGYWISPQKENYSFASIPVIWPHISDDNPADALPERLNTTGSGDMTFGAFFFLGGV